MAEEQNENEEARGAELFQARRRGVIALVVTVLVGVGGFYYFSGTSDLLGTGACKASGDCEGLLGVECLHAPTGNYCTHTCNRDEDCEPSFHCDSPPWERGATHAVCLREVPPAKR